MEIQSKCNEIKGVWYKATSDGVINDKDASTWISTVLNSSSWLQIRRSEFDSRYNQKKKVVGLEWGPLNLVSTTEELYGIKVAAPV
jgi:hypothetical protein